MDLQLNGKRAFVAGSSRGLGFASARRLVREGARVAINSRNEIELEKARATLAIESNLGVLGIPGDLLDAQAPARMMQQVISSFGGIDILITNAGGPPAGSFEKFNDEDWEIAVELSFLSHARLIRAALPELEKSSAPAILTITSFSVKQPAPGLILSNSIRAATIGLTKSLANELGPRGIRVNSILPGWTETERVEQLMAARAKTNGTTAEEEKGKLASEIPLRRLGTPEEFANVAAFLVSPAASYVNGVMLPVDGGFINTTF